MHENKVWNVPTGLKNDWNLNDLCSEGCPPMVSPDWLQERISGVSVLKASGSWKILTNVLFLMNGA